MGENCGEVSRNFAIYTVFCLLAAATCNLQPVWASCFFKCQIFGPGLFSNQHISAFGVLLRHKKTINQ
ncbi:hypothetical protein A4R26_25860 [Niastella populi]|uniref:Uncharacterized protein n=1 Tax=Niastella populi TaxID=550983 RepID=A0A1V9FD66_9BACT|nr:hypothetical protein A4R26_25860 [Niastella populi]